MRRRRKTDSRAGCSAATRTVLGALTHSGCSPPACCGRSSRSHRSGRHRALDGRSRSGMERSTHARAIPRRHGIPRPRRIGPCRRSPMRVGSAWVPWRLVGLGGMQLHVLHGDVLVAREHPARREPAVPRRACALLDAGARRFACQPPQLLAAVGSFGSRRVVDTCSAKRMRPSSTGRSRLRSCYLPLCASSTLQG